MKSTQLIDSLRLRKSSMVSRTSRLKVKKDRADAEIASQMLNMKKKSIPEDVLLEIAKGLHASVVAIMKAEELLEKIAGVLEKLPDQIEKAEAALKDQRGRFDRCTIVSVSSEEEVQWLVRNGVFRTLQIWGGLDDEVKVGLKRYAEGRGFYVKQI